MVFFLLSNRPRPSEILNPLLTNPGPALDVHAIIAFNFVVVVAFIIHDHAFLR